MGDYTALKLIGKGVTESTKLMVRGATGLMRIATKNTPEHRNNIRRGITEYKPSELGGFFQPTEAVGSMVVSGGNGKLRAEAIEAYTEQALQNQIPVIILHNGDYILEQYMINVLGPTGYLGVINSMNSIYEPFLDKNARDIAQMVMESAPKDMDIKGNIRTYVEGMCRFLRCRKSIPTVQLLSTCPHGQMLMRVDSEVMNGKITPEEGQAIKMRLMAGQSEYYKVENYFFDLNNQIDPILWKYRKGITQKPVNVLSTLKNRGALIIDICSSVNQMLLNLILAELRISQQQGYEVACVLSGIELSQNDYLKRTLEMSSGRYRISFSNQDVFAACNADDRFFNMLIGKSSKNVIFSHGSNVSATKWAEGIGMYDKEEKSYTHTQGKSHRPTDFFATRTSTDSYNISIKREYIVKPEEIIRMQDREAYIFTKEANELAHTLLV